MSIYKKRKIGQFVWINGTKYRIVKKQNGSVFYSTCKVCAKYCKYTTCENSTRRMCLMELPVHTCLELA